MIVANNILVNPVKGSAHMASRGMIIAGLSSNASQAIGSGSVQLLGCKKVNNKNIFVYLKLDSSSSYRLKYDIIFEFRGLQFVDKGNQKDGVFKDKTEMYVFSNSPDFVFTYAYAFNKINAIVPKYKHLLGIALTQAPKIKNPTADIGMPGSLFTGLYYLDSIGFFGNYRYQEFINGKEIPPQSFKTIMQISKALGKESKAANKLKPKVKKVDAKTRYKK